MIILFHNWANLAASFPLLDICSSSLISKTQEKGNIFKLQEVQKLWDEIINSSPKQICETKTKWLSVLSSLAQSFPLESNWHWKQQAVIENEIEAFLVSESGSKSIHQSKQITQILNKCDSSFYVNLKGFCIQRQRNENNRFQFFFFRAKNLIQNKIKQEKIWTKLLSNAQQTITKQKQTTKTYLQAR